MPITITIPGAVEATVGATAPAVLTVGVGIPGPTGAQGPAGSQGPVGPQGPAGAAGQGVPTGGSVGQYLVKTSGVDFATAWQSLSLSNYLTLDGGTMNADAVLQFEDTVLGQASEITGSSFAVSSTSNPNLVSNVLHDEIFVKTATSKTSMLPTGIRFPDLSVQTTAGISAATAASTYATIAAGQPTSGTVGQVLTKNSGTNYDSSWTTLIPGDRYLTTSTTSLSVSNGSKTLTVGTGLSYSSQQDVVISYDASNHMHAQVTSYNSGTGVLVVDVQNHTGSGTFASWTVNVGGTTPLQSVAWGDIVGTLGDQSDLATALNNKLETSTAASTYYLQTNPAGYTSLTTDQKNAVVNASYKTYSSSAFWEYNFTGIGTFTLYDSSVYSDAEEIYFQDDSVFGITSNTASQPYSRIINLPTTYGGAASTYYVEDLVSYLSGLGIGFTGSWSGPSATLTLDTFISTVGLGFYYLYKPVSQIQPGSKLMLEAGLNDYLAAIGVTYSAPNDSAYIYNAGAMSWGKPWETWAYSKASTDGLLAGYAKLSGTNNYSAGTQKLPASTTGYAPLNIAHGVAPTTPTNGDVWTTTSGLFYQINGSTISPATLAGGTYTGKITTLASSSTGAGLNLPHGTTPSAPVNGDIWTNTGGISARINGATVSVPVSNNSFTFTAGKLATVAAASASAGFTLQSGTAPTTPAAGDLWITSTALQYCSSAGTARTVVALQSTNAHTAGAKNTFLHNASLAGLNVGPAAGDPSTPADGDVWFNSTTNTLGFRSTRNFSLNACRAFVNFNGTGSGTWPGSTSTVSRTAGTTTATVTTVGAHGLTTGNTVYALTGVVAGIYTVTVINSTSFSFTTVETTALSAVSITFAVNTMRSNMNVSSITDNGVGDYTVNFAAALPDTNYVPVITVCGSSTTNVSNTGVVYGASSTGAGSKTTTALRIQTGSSSAGTLTDIAEINVAIFR